MSETEPDFKDWTEDPQVRQLMEDKMDHTDYLIFRALNEDGRMSDTELADRIGLSRTAVRRRRKNLQSEGILEILALLVFMEGDFPYADVHIRYSTDADDDAIEEFIMSFLDDGLVYEMAETMGEYDLLMRVWHGSLSEIKSYVKEQLHGNEVIESYNIVPITDSYKTFHRDFYTDSD